MVRKEYGNQYMRKMKIQMLTKVKTLLKFHIGQLQDQTTFLLILYVHLLWLGCIYYFSLPQEDGLENMKTKKRLGDERSNSFILKEYF